jgi:hypothetical protein
MGNLNSAILPLVNGRFINITPHVRSAFLGETGLIG